MYINPTQKNDLNNFLKTGVVQSILSRLWTTFADKKEQGKLIVNSEGDCYTNLKDIVVGMIPYFLSDDFGRDMYGQEIKRIVDKYGHRGLWVMIYKVELAHEMQHINSTTELSASGCRNLISGHLNSKYGINPGIGISFGAQLFNIVEDGRIEGIIAGKYPGMRIPLLLMNSQIRNGCTITNPPESAVDEFNYLRACILSYAKTGYLPKGHHHLKGTRLKTEFDKIQALIDAGIAGKYCADCADNCIKITETIGDYLAELMKRDSDIVDIVSQMVNQNKYNDKEKESNERGESPLRRSTKTVKRESTESEPSQSGSKNKENDTDSEPTEKNSKSKKQSSKDSNSQSNQGETGEDEKKAAGQNEGEEQKGGPGKDEAVEDGQLGDNVEDSPSGGDSNSDEESDESPNGDGSGGESDSDADGENKDKSVDGDSDNPGTGSDSESGGGTEKPEGDSEDDSMQEGYDESSEGEKPRHEGSDSAVGGGGCEDEPGWSEDELRKMGELLEKATNETAREEVLILKQHKLLEGGLSKAEINEVKQMYRDDYTTDFKETTLDLRPVETPCDIRQQGASLRRDIERILFLKNGRQSGLRRGVLDTSALWKIGVHEGSVFERKGARTKDYAFYLLQDGSGSMSGEKEYESAKTLAIIEEALRDYSALKITTFSTSGGKVCHHTAKQFGDNRKFNHSYAFLKERSAGGCNKDGYSIRIATKELMARREREKVLFVLSDGLPSEYKGGDRQAVQDVQVAVEEARSSGIAVVSIMFGTDDFIRNAKSVYEQMYQHSILSCSPKDIGRKLMPILKSIVRR